MIFLIIIRNALRDLRFNVFEGTDYFAFYYLIVGVLLHRTNRTIRTSPAGRTGQMFANSGAKVRLFFETTKFYDNFLS